MASTVRRSTDAGASYSPWVTLADANDPLSNQLTPLDWPRFALWSGAAGEARAFPPLKTTFLPSPPRPVISQRVRQDKLLGGRAFRNQSRLAQGLELPQHPGDPDPPGRIPGGRVTRDQLPRPHLVA